MAEEDSKRGRRRIGKKRVQTTWCRTFKLLSSESENVRAPGVGENGDRAESGRVKLEDPILSVNGHSNDYDIAQDIIASRSVVVSPITATTTTLQTRLQHSP
jgi:hypothetical protein